MSVSVVSAAVISLSIHRRQRLLAGSMSTDRDRLNGFGSLKGSNATLQNSNVIFEFFNFDFQTTFLNCWNLVAANVLSHRSEIDRIPTVEPFSSDALTSSSIATSAMIATTEALKLTAAVTRSGRFVWSRWGLGGGPGGPVPHGDDQEGKPQKWSREGASIFLKGTE
jgi:hypothetical protein